MMTRGKNSAAGLLGPLLVCLAVLGCGDRGVRQAARPDERSPTTQAESRPGETRPIEQDDRASEPPDEVGPAGEDEPEEAAPPDEAAPPHVSRPKVGTAAKPDARPLHSLSADRRPKELARPPRRFPTADAMPRAAREERAAEDTAAREEPAKPPVAKMEKRSVAASAAASDKPYRMVSVFYATDRQADDGSSASHLSVTNILPVAVPAALAFLLAMLGLSGLRRRLTLRLAVISLMVTLVTGGYWGYRRLNDIRHVDRSGVRYGDERGEMQLGTCQVSIPWTHEVGEVEAPSILRLEIREDVRKHVILQTTQPTPEDEFYDKLRDRVSSASRSEVFVFVHGYNVTFEKAARRTAQIAYDVDFAGAPIFFSWPSQGGLWKYTIDETNVAWAVPHLKQFLLDVVHRSGAKSVNLIAHSMGNRALTGALRELQLELDDEPTLFNQVILAAPDIDAGIFRRDLAPALVRAARKVTLYASSKDQALAASKKVHGYPRAGDSGSGLVVLSGIDTIDVSTVDTSLLGHSYYGSSNPILADIGLLIDDARPPSQRSWLHPRPYGELTYWVFEPIGETATRAASPNRG